MAVEIGSVVEGKVSGITNFGVFVDIGDGATGMVHISEVAKNYVKDIKEHVHMGQEVKVKVISISPEGKIGLTMKQAGPPEQREERRERQPRRQSEPSQRGADSFEFRPRQQENLSFEDMMSRFKQSSDEKMSDLKRVIDTRRGSQNRRSKQ